MQFNWWQFGHRSLLTSLVKPHFCKDHWSARLFLSYDPTGGGLRRFVLLAAGLAHPTVRPLRLAWRAAMDEPLYDEFGNYVGPPLDQDEEEDEEEAPEARPRPSRTAATSAHACALLAAGPRHTCRYEVQPHATLRKNTAFVFFAFP